MNMLNKVSQTGLKDFNTNAKSFLLYKYRSENNFVASKVRIIMQDAQVDCQNDKTFYNIVYRI